jgi:hypothetical protein
MSADVAGRVSSAIAAAPHEVDAQLVIDCLAWWAGRDQDIDVGRSTASDVTF